MNNPKEIFLKYLPKRDVVFVLGAGASQPDGVPLQKEMLPMIMDGRFSDITTSEMGQLVTQFINDNFKYTAKRYPELEAVFGFLDHFIQHNESLNVKYPLSEIFRIKEYLINLLHYIVDYETNKPSSVYEKFWSSVKKYNGNISIISLNYDTLIEHSFASLFKSFGYIDYCTHLMNFDNYEHVKNYSKWINPREPVLITEDETPIPIKLMKIHGSLNWKYCNCCNQMLLTPWDRKIDLNRGKLLGYTYPDNEEYEFVCPLDGTEFQTLIVPPSYIKPLKHPIISQLLSEASREIRATKKIVFIGYSLSNADVHVKALLKKQINPEIEMIVINNKISKNLKLRYKALHEKTTFIQSSFEDVVSDEKLIEELLT